MEHREAFYVALILSQILALYKSFTYLLRWYGDGAGNTLEENSSIFSLIRMR